MKEHIKSLNLLSPSTEVLGRTTPVTCLIENRPAPTQPWELQSRTTLKAPRREQKKNEKTLSGREGRTRERQLNGQRGNRKDRFLAKTTLMEHFLRARHTNSFNPLNALVVAISRWEGFEAEKWSNLPRITQPVNWQSQVLNWGRIWLQSQDLILHLPKCTLLSLGTGEVWREKIKTCGQRQISKMVS